MPPSVETPQTSLLSSNKITKIINGRILKDGKIIENDYLWIREGKFIDPAQHFYDEKSSPEQIIDAKGALVVPGFIELQINGAYGVDFTGDFETIEEGVKKVSKAILDQGVTSYCPTIVSSFPNVYERVLPALVPRKGTVENGAEVLGAHLEGPFMSDLKYGAHDVNTLRDAKNGITDLESVYGNLDNHNKAISLITVAPDVDGILDAIPDLVKRVPAVSIGHTAAPTTVAEEGVRRGAKMVTHLFNAMNQFHHRDPGCIGLLGSSLNRPFYGIICDGVHVHPNSVKIAYYSHPKGACLVTDAMAAAGLADGAYTLGKMNVEVKGKKITIAGTDTIAGSNVKMYECVQNFKKFTGCTTVEAVEAATLHPAQVLGIQDRKGTLNCGADADFLFLDEDLNLLKLFINGEEAQI